MPHKHKLNLYAIDLSISVLAKETAMSSRGVSSKRTWRLQEDMVVLTVLPEIFINYSAGTGNKAAKALKKKHVQRESRGASCFLARID